LLVVPMLKESNLVGTISIFRQEVQLFSEKQIELVRNFAAQAVIAIENARLLSELQQALERQTASAHVLKVISSSPGALEPAFDALLENATRLCGATHGNLWLTEGDGFRSVAVLGELPTTYLGRWGVGALFNPEPDIPIAIAARTREPFQYPDLRKSPPYLNGDALARSAVHDAGILSVLAVPMLKEGAAMGAILIYAKEARLFAEPPV
jgi:GAF domain-containing protein